MYTYDYTIIQHSTGNKKIPKLKRENINCFYLIQSIRIVKFIVSTKVNVPEIH